MKISVGNIEHIHIIRDIAIRTWDEAYRGILSPEQIDYMIEMMYSPEALGQQMGALGHHFYLIKEDDSDHWQGFVSYEYDYDCDSDSDSDSGSGERYRTKLHKLYVLPECQGLGFGKALIDKVCEDAKAYCNRSVLLNMNRSNTAYGFYEYMGFRIVGQESIDIGNNYFMEDYVFEKKV